ncbi:MAG: cell envelope integrity protein CreD [Betaproteobacteria bacterium]|nr:cell envelope integrity protein CreD [Betaproteobacteria bacterium]
MGRALLLKTFGIGILALVLLVPIGMIRDLIGERQARRTQAVQEIAAGWGAQQSIAGPWLVAPYRRTWIETVNETVDGQQKERRIERSESGVLRLPVDSVGWTVEAAASEKSRGIHKARLYAARIRAEGAVTVPARYGANESEGRTEWFAPRLVLGVQDPRGIRAIGGLEFAGQAYEFAPGTLDAALPAGVHAVLPPLHAPRAQQFAFRFAFDLAGAESFALVPLANDTSLDFSADWPHPSFQGQFLPSSHEIGETGFKARWRVSRYAAQGAERLRACGAARGCAGFGEQSLVVSFIEPVGVYQQLDRASKYGFLFVGLVFAAFFLFELVRQLAIHPIQYCLVGLSLAMFFLLLTALSEHLPFAAAYASGAAACVGLVTSYVVRVLRSAWLGLAFGAALGLLYGALYLLLKAEDYALLSGAVLVFALLAGVMLGTRKIDWYAVTGTRKGAPAAAV